MREIKTNNPELIQLIRLLKKESKEKQAAIWLDLAEDLSCSRSRSVVVNLGKISRNTKRSETVVVPGKVLGTGNMNHAVTVASFGASQKAKEKIGLAKGTYISIPELLEKNPKGTNVRIIR
jgi:large subunit ribosomal protein L18e